MALKTTYDLLKVIVDALDCDINIASVIDNTDGTYTINTCNTKWLSLKRIITINSVDYLIKDLEPNESILVSGSVIPSGNSFTIYKPFFKHGTVLASKKEFNDKLLSKDKLPLIWLREILSEKFKPLEQDAIDRYSDCDIYFLIESDFNSWDNDQHYKYGVMPMRNLLFQLENDIRNNTGIGIYEDFEVTNHPKFGVYVTEKGSENNIFEAKLDGSRLQITIPFEKTFVEQCCTN